MTDLDPVTYLFAGGTFVALTATILVWVAGGAQTHRVDTERRCEVRYSTGDCGRRGAQPVEVGHAVRNVCPSCLKKGAAW